MNFIQLQNRRINLDQVTGYFPDERTVDILNKKVDWYNIIVEFDSQNVVIGYREDLAARDTDLMMLDFVCVKNKRGNVKELQKKQEES